MFFKADSTEIHELSQASVQHEDQGALLNQETIVQDDYRLAYRHRQSNKRPLRFCLCCTFLSALFLAILIILVSLFVIHSNNETPWQDKVRIELLWTSAFPKLITESAFRLVDCNSDGVLDVIFGYGTGVDTLESNRLLCDLYFNGIYPCNGGVKALDGRNGLVLWSFDKSNHEVFALNCQRDLDGDRIPDCLTGGRGGTFEAISGKTGSLIWAFHNDVRSSRMNFYTPLYLNEDYDGDGLTDLVTVHGGDPTRNPHDTVRLAGELLLISSRTGRLLNVSFVPDQMESYYSPQLLRRSKSEQYILVGTGGETHGGGLYAFNVRCWKSLCASPYVKIISDEYKGVMTPPVLVDVNNDQIEDIIIPLYNSTLFAFDGATFRQLWNKTFPSSETYSSPAVGYFNDDDTPDIMIHYQTGPGYPLYYSAQSTVLDGRTGIPLLNQPIEQTVGAQSSPLTVSFQGRGQDMFLYWMGACEMKETTSERKIDYDKKMPSALLSHADICKLRYQTTSFTTLYGLTQSLPPPGISIYNSNQYVALERSTTKANTLDIRAFLQQYPNYSSIYEGWQRLDSYMQDVNTNRTTPSPPSDDDAAEVDNDDDNDDDDNEENEMETLLTRRRDKRHVGPHDDGGLQRTISTGTLAPSFELNSKSTIDLVFATYWIHSDTSTLLHADERTCIQEGMAKEEERLKQNDDIIAGMDHDAYEHYIEDLCMNKTRLFETVLKISPELMDAVQVSMSNPFKKQLGQLTVYRVRLHFRKEQCKTTDSTQCSAMKDNDRLLPYHQQLWPAYMGIRGDSHANLG